MCPLIEQVGADANVNMNAIPNASSDVKVSVE
jgi:hypothetical protein